MFVQQFKDTEFNYFSDRQCISYIFIMAKGS